MMESVASVIGIVGVVLTLFYFSTQLEKKYDLLRLIIVLFAMTLLLLVPKAMIDAQTVCESVVTNSTDISSTVTSYEYADFCYVRPETTPSVFWKVLGTFYLLFYGYLLIYLLMMAFKTILDWKRRAK